MARTADARSAGVAFRPDGAQIAVPCAGRSPACQILDAETGRLVRSISLPSHSGIDCVAWSPDGTTLATASDDRKIYLWDAATGLRKATLEGHTNGGLRPAFHPAGTLLASNGWESRLRLWDPVLGRPWLNVPGTCSASGFGVQPRRPNRGLARGPMILTYQVDPALEYRTFAHTTSRPIDYAHLGSPPRRPRPGRGHATRAWSCGTWPTARSSPSCRSATRTTSLFEASGDLLTERSERRAALASPARLQLPPYEGGARGSQG